MQCAFKKQTNVYVCVGLSICFCWNTVALFGHVSVHVSACSRTHVWMDKQHIKIQVIPPPAVILALHQAQTLFSIVRTQTFVPQSPPKGWKSAQSQDLFPLQLNSLLSCSQVSNELRAKEKTRLNFQSTGCINLKVPKHRFIYSGVTPFFPVFCLFFFHHKPLFSRWAHGQNNMSYVTGAVKEGTSHPCYQGSCLLWLTVK